MSKNPRSTHLKIYTSGDDPLFSRTVMMASRLEKSCLRSPSFNDPIREDKLTKMLSIS